MIGGGVDLERFVRLDVGFVTTDSERVTLSLSFPVEVFTDSEKSGDVFPAGNVAVAVAGAVAVVVAVEVDAVDVTAAGHGDVGEGRSRVC